MSNFEIVGKLKAMKGSDKFNPFETKDFDSGWQNTRLRFNVISATNRIAVEIAGGKWKDDSRNKIVTFAKAENGAKAQRTEVSWDKRRDAEIIAGIAPWRVYTVDLLTYDERKNAEDKTEKKYQFLEKTEMATLVNKIITSGKYDDCLFKLTGDVDFQYSAKENRYYRTFSVNRIYKVSNDTAPKAEMNINVFYTNDAVNADNYDESKKYYVDCYTDYYFNQIKANRFVPMQLVINRNENEAQAAGFKRKFEDFDDEAVVRKRGFVCDIIDGAEQRSITIDDLDDATREDIALGLISVEDAIKSVGGVMNGNYVSELRIKSLASAKQSEATAYVVDDLRKLPVPDAQPEPEIDIFANGALDDDDDFDI